MLSFPDRGRNDDTSRADRRVCLARELTAQPIVPPAKNGRHLLQVVQPAQHLRPFPVLAARRQARYAAHSWPRKRRVIMKAEVVRLAGREPRDNPRFVVSNLPQSPRRVYALYRKRGDVENRLKELHYGLGFDRTSCPRFWANAFRVLLTAAVYVLLQSLRQRLATTPAADYQVGTLRERLLKLGTRVQVSTRRIVLHLPSAFPWLALWQVVALAIGASSG
jgi:hypothetical protein